MDVNALVTSERSRLVELEAVVKRGLATFVQVGQARLEIREARLYRETHATFEDYCRQRWGMERAHAYRQIRAAEVAAALSPTGDVPTTERQARELAPLLREDEAAAVEVWGELRSTYGDRLTADKVRTAVAQRLLSERTTAVLGSSESDEWYTPARYLDAVREVLGSIDLDPASNQFANETVRATAYYDVESDGLARTWHGRLFLNPPYGRKGPLFVEKLRSEYATGNVSEAILLCSAYSTETRWFQPLFDRPICFVDHRIDFYSPSGRGGAATFANAFVYFGERPERFAVAFAAFGSVVERSAFARALREAA